MAADHRQRRAVDGSGGRRTINAPPVDRHRRLEGDAIGLTATYRFDSDDDQRGPYSAAFRFVGRRVGTEGSQDPRDRFDRIERIHGVLPGSGTITVTTRVVGVNAGQWEVIAVPVSDGGTSQAGAEPARRNASKAAEA